MRVGQAFLSSLSTVGSVKKFALWSFLDAFVIKAILYSWDIIQLVWSLIYLIWETHLQHWVKTKYCNWDRGYCKNSWTFLQGLASCWQNPGNFHVFQVWMQILILKLYLLNCEIHEMKTFQKISIEVVKFFRGFRNRVRKWKFTTCFINCGVQWPPLCTGALKVSSDADPLLMRAWLVLYSKFETKSDTRTSKEKTVLSIIPPWARTLSKLGVFKSISKNPIRGGAKSSHVPISGRNV